ncbi:MAG: hypothetical protein GXP62_13895 [Oligoflexia bacterium]|nr:hypothetical protein [Oligoflexia bacterium]
MYRRLLAVPGGHLEYADHWRGFLAAQALGDAIAQAKRLDAAVAIQASSEAVTAQAMLMAWYGRVDIRISAKLDPRPPLTMLDIPFEAAPRRVLEAATAAVAMDGRYTGLLPLGMYKLGSTSFEILGQDQPVVIKVKR